MQCDNKHVYSNCMSYCKVLDQNLTLQILYLAQLFYDLAKSGSGVYFLFWTVVLCTPVSAVAVLHPDAMDIQEHARIIWDTI